MKDALGDRMKAYEAATETRINRGSYIIARLDGRSFSRFTRDLNKPYDVRMSEAMMTVTQKLVSDNHALISYTQSDEITLVFSPNEEGTFFDGRIQKISSVLAGQASVAFIRELFARNMTEYVERSPHFDCRVFSVPDLTEAANTLLWRVRDATKNAISMVAQHHFSHKALHGISGEGKLAMLAEKGIIFEHAPSFFRNGSFWKRHVVERILTFDELENIPEQHRPAVGEKVFRSEIKRVEMPDHIMFGDIFSAI